MTHNRHTRTHTVLGPLIITLLLIPTAIIQAQDNTPLYLGSGVKVEDHPNNFNEYRHLAPETTEICQGVEMAASCGRVWWNSRLQPKLNTRYMTQVPALVRLIGPKKDVWWAPFAHCMIDGTDRKLRSASPPGVQCITVLKSPGERMEWAIGGIVEGIDLTLPGTYNGTIPFTVTGPGTQWEIDVPVTYTVHERESSCTITGDVDAEFELEQGQSAEKTVSFTVIGADETIKPVVLRNYLKRGFDATFGDPVKIDVNSWEIRISVTVPDDMPPGTYYRSFGVRVHCS